MAAISAPIELGTNFATGPSSTLSLTVGNNVPAGAFVALPLSIGGGGSIPATFTDGAGNTWASFGTVAPPIHHGKAALFYSFLINPLTAGMSISPPWPDTHAKMIGATAWTGVNSLDVSVQSNGTVEQVNLQTGNLHQLNELALWMLWVDAGANDPDYVEDANATNDFTINNGASLRLGWSLPPNLSPLTYGPLLGAPNSWGALGAILKGDNPTTPRRRLVGRGGGSGPITPPRPPLIWSLIGDLKDYPAVVGVASAFPVKRFRIFCDVQNVLNGGVIDPTMGNPNFAPYLTMAANLKAANIGLVLTLLNKLGGLLGHGYPTDTAAYQAQVAACLDALQPVRATCENEMDSYEPQYAHTGGDESDAAQAEAIAISTSATYASQLALFIDVCRSRGAYAGALGIPAGQTQHRNYPDAPGGVSSTGMIRGLWLDSWLQANGSGRLFADWIVSTFVRSDNTVFAGDVPTSTNPTKPIFGAATASGNTNPIMQCYAARQFITDGGFAAAGGSVFDAHCFARNAAAVAVFNAAFGWGSRASGLPLVSLASGQEDQNTLTTRAVHSMALSRGALEWTAFSSGRTGVKASQMFDSVTGIRNALGDDWAALIREFPS